MLLIAQTFLGGPVGIETIAAVLSEPRDAIEDIIEPYLLQQGFIQRTAAAHLHQKLGVIWGFVPRLPHKNILNCSICQTMHPARRFYGMRLMIDFLFQEMLCRCFAWMIYHEL